MSKLISAILKELREAAPAMVFFFIMFQLVITTKSLLLEEYDITPTGATVATVAALIVGKAVLIADKLPFVNLFARRPAIFAVIWKTIIYGCIALLFRYIEEVIPLISKYGGFGGANAHLIKEISWPHFWATQMWLVAALIMFCVTSEVVNELGADRIKKIFLASRS